MAALQTQTYLSIDGNEHLIDPPGVGGFSSIAFRIGILTDPSFVRTLTVDWVRVGTAGYGSDDLFGWEAGDDGIPPFDVNSGNAPTLWSGGETFFDNLPPPGFVPAYIQKTLAVDGNEFGFDMYLAARMRINIVDTAFDLFSYAVSNINAGNHVAAAVSHVGGDHWGLSSEPGQPGGNYGNLIEGQYYTVGHRLEVTAPPTNMIVKRTLHTFRPSHNDAFARAWPLDTQEGVDLYAPPWSIAGNSMEAGEPTPISFSALYRTVWFKYQPTQDGQLRLMPGHPCKAAVYHGTSLSDLLVLVAGSAPSLPVSKGSTYYIQVGVDSESLNGTGTLAYRLN